MTTNTTEHTFTSEAITRALTRRAITILLNTSTAKTTKHRNLGEATILGIAEAMTVLELAHTPFEFTTAFDRAVDAAGPCPPHSSGTRRAAWIDTVIDAVTEELI